MSGKANQISIVALNHRNLRDVVGVTASFEVESHLVPKIDNGVLSYAVEPVPQSYTKSYLNVEHDYSAYIDNSDRSAYLAYVGNNLAGRILIRRNWNGYGYVEDVRVSFKFRRAAVGTRLMEAAMVWAKRGGMPGIMLETQDNNVPAVKFYESCGFKLGGFDSYLYKGVNPNSNEIALFWYRIF